jgi:hypothetical protein
VKQAYVEATFENPSYPEEPITVPAVQLQNPPDQADFKHPRYYFLSPALTKLDCKLYNIKITAYTDRSKSQVITEHENQLLSRINSDSCVKSEFMERMNEAARQSDWQQRQ